MNRIIGVTRVDGYPIPVVGLIEPCLSNDGLVSLFIADASALHVSETAVRFTHKTAHQFFREHCWSKLYSIIDECLAAIGGTNTFERLAVLYYCLAAKLSLADEVEKAARVVVAAHRDLVSQITRQNHRVAH